MTDLLTPDTIVRWDKWGQMAKAAELKDLGSIKDAVLEPKYDGHRVYAYIGDTGPRLFARSGVEKTQLLPHIVEELSYLPEGTWVDGEACGDGDEWGTVQSVLGSKTLSPDHKRITFLVFDMMSYDGLDMRDLPLRDRRAHGEAAFNSLLPGGGSFGFAHWGATFTPSQAIYDQLLSQGYEGAIVKDMDAPYASGKRGKGWFKIKVEWTMDAVVLGVKEGKGKYVGTLGALIFGQRLPGEDVLLVKDKDIVKVGAMRFGIRGAAAGMNDALRDEFWAAHEAGTLVGTVIEVAHMGADLSETGRVRHPRWKRTRTDKTPYDCDWRTA